MDEKEKIEDINDKTKDVVEEKNEEIVKENSEEITKDTEQVNEQFEKLKDSFTRLQADFTNYKRRQEKEKSDIYKYASEGLVIKLLSVMDNFDRALKGADKEDTLTKGIVMIKSELENILTQEGVEEIVSDNEKFDANLHHAVFMEENDEVESEHIIETFQKGYKLKDKVIRPAMVKVSK